MKFSKIFAIILFILTIHCLGAVPVPDISLAFQDQDVSYLPYSAQYGAEPMGGIPWGNISLPWSFQIGLPLLEDTLFFHYELFLGSDNAPITKSSIEAAYQVFQQRGGIRFSIANISSLESTALLFCTDLTAGYELFFHPQGSSTSLSQAFMASLCVPLPFSSYLPFHPHLLFQGQSNGSSRHSCSASLQLSHEWSGAAFSFTGGIEHLDPSGLLEEYRIIFSLSCTCGTSCSE